MLSSLVPYTLELVALRRLATHVFGLLMSLEPAVAAIAGIVVLGQSITLVLGIALVLVIVASVGITLTSRTPPPPSTCPSRGPEPETPSGGRPGDVGRRRDRVVDEDGGDSGGGAELSAVEDPGADRGGQRRAGRERSRPQRLRPRRRRIHRLTWDDSLVLNALIPTVFYADLNVGLDLFVDGVGMDVVHRDGELAVLARDHAKVYLVQSAESAAGDRPELAIETDAIDPVWADISERRPDLLHPNLRVVTRQPWGPREFALLDATTVCVIFRDWT